MLNAFFVFLLKLLSDGGSPLPPQGINPVAERGYHAGPPQGLLSTIEVSVLECTGTHAGDQIDLGLDLLQKKVKRGDDVRGVVTGHKKSTFLKGWGISTWHYRSSYVSN